jgi:hypothetical protein
MNNENDVITRYLIRVKIYAGKNGVLTVLKTQEIESDSQSLVNLPPLDILAPDVSVSVELEFVEKRLYKQSSSCSSMIERIEE